MRKFEDHFCPTCIFLHGPFSTLFSSFSCLRFLPFFLSVFLVLKTYKPMYLAYRVQMHTYSSFNLTGKSKRHFSLLNLTYYYGKLDFFWSVSSRVFFESILFVLLLGVYLSIQEKSPYRQLLCLIQSKNQNFEMYLYNSSEKLY